MAGVGSVLYLMESNPGEGRASLGLGYKESLFLGQKQATYSFTTLLHGHQSTVASNKVFWGGVGI